MSIKNIAKQKEELQRRLDKLKSKQMENQKVGNLGQQFEEIGKTFREVKENIPHIKLGDNKSVNKPIQYNPLTEKIRKWLFIGLTILVGGTAVALIVWRLISRFI